MNTPTNEDHRLAVTEVRLVGGNRVVEFSATFSVVRGSITTGKTTLVRLIRAMLGRVPDHLPPEASSLTAVRGRVDIASETWVIRRPVTSTETALVQLGRWERAPEDPEGPEQLVETLRLPAETPTATEDTTYQTWLLHKLGLPEVSVPRARTDAASAQIPVTINDWLGYCLVRDDEIDTAVFGHQNPWRDRKRRAVFELVYGLYDATTSALQADLRATELKLESLHQASLSVQEFLRGTAIGSLEEIDRRILALADELVSLDQSREELSSLARVETESVALRDAVAAAEQRLDRTRRRRREATRSLEELQDLHQTLHSQSDRLTRAIVAEEWLVDFDFVVCPRCGTQVQQDRAHADHCYLCLQVPEDENHHGELVLEQERVASQIVETAKLIDQRTDDVAETALAENRVVADLTQLHGELERRTSEFVSATSEAIATGAERRARVEAQLAEQRRYRELLVRLHNTDEMRSELEERLAELEDELARRSRTDDAAEANIQALEDRFQEYVTRLGLVLSDNPAVATINRATYLPQIDGRPFDELSSQGLSVLVNVAHALAHHTVALDRGLPLPGFLVLDGVSNNVGHEGFDLDRRDDAYRLMMEESNAYQGSLQLVVLDNDVPPFAAPYVVLTLTPEDRLVGNEAAGAQERTMDDEAN